MMASRGRRNDWQNWRRRTFADAIKPTGLARARPYDLRHSFASLLLAEGRTIDYGAKQLGHSALMTMNTYGHVIDELEDEVARGPGDRDPASTQRPTARRALTRCP
jgi:integrase